VRKRQEEIKANMERAAESLAAAQELTARGYHDIAASRAYYAAFYAASAALLQASLETSKHSGVVALIHQHFVRTGLLPREHGRALNWLYELRGIGDYGLTVHVAEDEAICAIDLAERFVRAIKSLLETERE
jgi:uncharacterized protein (UPF0332 family)